MSSFVVVGFGFGRPSVFVRRGRYLAGVVRMLIPSSTVPLPPPPLLHQPRYLSAPPTPQNTVASSLVFGAFLLFGRVGRLPRLVAWSFGGSVVVWFCVCCALVLLCCCGSCGAVLQCACAVVLLCCSGGLCCVWCVCRVWSLRGVLVCRACGVLVSCLCVVLVCGTFYTMPVWCLCVLPACGAERGWCIARLKTDTAPMLSLHRT